MVERVSSQLVRIESVIAIRRAGMILSNKGVKEAESWMSEKFARLTPYLDCITCKRIDDSIEEAIKDSDVLSQCRTLDAIHMGTAVSYQSYLPEPLGICSLDNRMSKVPRELGFRILPETV